MKERNFFILTLAMSIIVVLTLGIFTYCINNIKFSSPKLFSGISARKYNSIIAKNFDYDAVILGSSMSQGFKCSEFDKVFNCESIKMTMPGANFKEISFIAEYAMKYRDIKIAMLDSSVYFFRQKITLEQIPKEHYKEKNHFTMLKKSLAITDFVQAIDFFIKFIKGKVKYTTRDELYDWNLSNKCGEKYFAKALLYKNTTYSFFDNNALNNVNENLNKVLIPLFTRHKDKKFILFFPPYSIMFYRSVDPTLYVKLKSQIIDNLLTMNNIMIYDFETAFNITQNFNNYKDVTHYSGRINSWILSEISKGNYLLTKQNKEHQLKLLHDKLSSYDYNKTYEYMKKKYSSTLKKKKKKK